MVAEVGCSGAVGQHQALKTPVVGVAQGGVHAHVGGDARQNQIGDAARAQHHLQIRRIKRAFAGLVYHHFARQRRQLGNDLPAGLATHQDAATGAVIANADTASADLA